MRRELIDGGVRIRIGDADQEVTPGEHNYVIRYTTTRQLNFSNPAFDELYWNVTGNFWRFPIDAAEVRVHLPQAVPVRPDLLLYRARSARPGHDAEVVSQGPGEIVIRTTGRSAEGEGLTISVTWPKGVVAAPPPPSAFGLVPGLRPDRRRDHRLCSRLAASISTPGCRPGAGRCPGRSCLCSSRPRA